MEKFDDIDEGLLLTDPAPESCFFKCWHKMCFLGLLLFAFSYLLSDEWALYNNRADTCRQLFKCLDGPSLSCRAEPAGLHIQLRVWASSHLLLQIAMWFYFRSV